MKNKIKKICSILLLFSTSLALNGQTRVLEVPFITQQPNNQWCWASACAMASTYYGNNSSMCGIVEWARLNLTSPNRGSSNCCGLPTPTLCNQGIYISNIPTILTSEGLACTSTGVVSLASVKDIINDNRPLIIQGNRNVTSWHTMIIVGYNNNDLHYIDPWDGYHINSYTDATTIECLGAFLYKWKDYSHILTTIACPPNLSLHNTIGANANIHAQVSITIDGIINNNSIVTLLSGSNITFNPGFEIQIGSTLNANVTSNPCQ
jgi:uncharacterized protein YvpB